MSSARIQPRLVLDTGCSAPERGPSAARPDVMDYGPAIASTTRRSSRRELEVVALEVLAHVAGIGRAGQGLHADLEREAEDDLGRRPAEACHEPLEGGVAQLAELAVSSEKPW